MNKDISSGRLSLVFYYHRLNHYSFNAIAGAVDGDPCLAELPISLAATVEQLQAAAAGALKSHSHVIAALSIMTSQWIETRRLVQQLRLDFGTRITILAGGPHATACADSVLKAGVDIVFRGEAEESFPSALKRMLEEREFCNVPGISFLRDGEVTANPQAQPVNLDAFFSFSPQRGMLGPIEITRGCPFACSFCQTSHIFGVQPRHRSIDNIVRQAASLRSSGRRIVRLLSPNAFSYGSPNGRELNLKAMRELLAALRETVTAGGRIIFGHFPSEVRPEHVIPETLDLLKEFADNDEIVIGAQSGSRRMLDACRRSHTTEDVLAAVSLARKYGFKVIVDFIFGLPGENETDTRETMAAIEQLVRLGARIHPHTFAPLPQTDFSVAHQGYISPGVLKVLEELKARRDDVLIRGKDIAAEKKQAMEDTECAEF